METQLVLESTGIKIQCMIETACEVFDEWECRTLAGQIEQNYWQQLQPPHGFQPSSWKKLPQTWGRYKKLAAIEWAYVSKLAGK
jgi:hypothetical protein